MSVVLPIYNAASTLAAALDSLLAQTFRDFEIIAVDDGSTDATPAILADYRQRDERIAVLTFEANRGIIAALNAGCARAQGEFIARLDADDIALPDRFVQQVVFLDQQPDIDVLGTAMALMDAGGQVYGATIPPTLPGVVAWATIFSTYTYHPSIMMRRAFAASMGFYREEDSGVEDYGLWTRASQVTRLANLPQPLIQHRVWASSLTGRLGDTVHARRLGIIQANAAHWLGEPIAPGVADAFYRLARFRGHLLPPDPALIADTADVLDRLHTRFNSMQPLNRAEKIAIARDLALKFVFLALSAARCAPGLGLHLLARALRYDPLIGLKLARIAGGKVRQRLLGYNRAGY